MEYLALLIVLGAVGWVVYKMYQYFRFRNMEYENQMKLQIAIQKSQDDTNKILQEIGKKLKIKVKIGEIDEEPKDVGSGQ